VKNLMLDTGEKIGFKDSRGLGFEGKEKDWFWVLTTLGTLGTLNFRHFKL
jgi:hypothetical protein